MTTPTPSPLGTRERTRAIALRVLREQGELVGAQRVRDEIGYGSLQTINQELRRVRQEWATRLERSLALPEVPGEIAADASAFMQTLWQRALAQAQSEFESEREALKDDNARLFQQLALRDQEIQQLEADKAALASQLQHAEQRGTEQVASLELIRTELAQQRVERQAERELAASAQRALEEKLAEVSAATAEQIRQYETRLALLNDDLLSQQAVHEQERTRKDLTHQRVLREEAHQRELLQQKIAQQANALALAEERSTHQQLQLEESQQQLRVQEQERDQRRERAAVDQVHLAKLQAELASAVATRDETRRLLDELLSRLPTPTGKS